MKVKLLVILCVVLIGLNACNQSNKSVKNYQDIYEMTFYSMMELDKGLNNSMKYIAIDMSNLEQLTNQEKIDIMRSLENRYKVDVMESTFQQLKDNGLFNNKTFSLEGIFLQIEKIEEKNNQIVLEGMKYRSGLGAIGVKTTIKYKSNNWQVEEAGIIWIS